MKRKIFLVLYLRLMTACFASDEHMKIFIPAQTDETVQFAAEELKEQLSWLYDRPVRVGHHWPESDVLLFTNNHLPDSFKSHLQAAEIPESFHIGSVSGKNGLQQVVICGSDPSGVLYGVYELVELIMSKIQGSPWVDISFGFEKGSARNHPFASLNPDIRKTPFYKNRGIHLDFIGLGAAAMLGIDPAQPQDIEVWERWSDWCARHRLNFMTSWPYGKTNWWELVPDSVLPGATHFTDRQLQAGIDRRRELLRYSRIRGIDPYLMNYVPGRGSSEMVESYPYLFSNQLDHGKPLASFCYNQKEVYEIFDGVIAAVTRTYPEMAGFNLRRWGESYPCECDFCKGRDPELSRQLLVNMMKQAKAARPDIKLLLSGYAAPDYAAYFPDHVTCMIKWGNDWDPSPDPGISADYLNAYGRKDVIIDIALPCEESFPLGLIEHRYLAEGILKYTGDPAAFPNLTGFAAGLGDSETHFLTELNYVVFAKLVRDPAGFDVQAFCRAYLVNRFGDSAADDLLASLNIQSDIWNQFFCSIERGGYGFLNLAPYSNWARFGDLYTSFPHANTKALDWIMKQSTEELKTSLNLLTPLLQEQEKAMALVLDVKAQIRQTGQFMYTDYQLQTKGYLHYLESREALLKAIIAEREGYINFSRDQLHIAVSKNEALHQTLTCKPNNVGYGDQGGNIADWELSRLLEGITEENRRLKSMSVE